jgi:hypothetical protein
MRARWGGWALGLLVGVVACASPAPPPPRFAAGGPDAQELGAGAGYPKGDRATFFRIESIVGSHSHQFSGIRGQRIYVDPRSKLVMVNTAVHKRPIDVPALREANALWTAVVRQLGD